MKFKFSYMLAVAAVTIAACTKSPVTPDNPGDNPNPQDTTGTTTPPKDTTVTPGPTPDPTVVDPEGYGPLPSTAQVNWQRMETNMFVHFGPNTFTNLEWGYGTDDEIAAFKPEKVDCDQWVSIAKECDFKGIILTAKHHDGFCLWPNANSTHTIAQSSYKNGKGDIVKELSDACAKGGVKFGVYDSPWDRHDPNYGAGASYNKIFESTVKDLHTNYGDIFEQWFDGAKGEDGKTQNYDFTMFNNAALDIHPDCIIFSNVGPGCRWCGQEWGDAWPTCWSTFSPSAHNASQSSLPGSYESYLGQGDEPDTKGAVWLPIECDTSIRTKDQQDNGNPMWFWNNLGNEKTRSAKNLMQLYYQTVGRNGLLLLNVPPTTAGVLDDKDIKSLREFKQMKDQIFGTNLADGATATATKVRGNSTEKYGPQNMLDGKYDTYFATDDKDKAVAIEFTLPEARTFNRIMLQEYIPLGQRVKSFSVSYKEEGGTSWKTLTNGTTIGHKRILLTSSVKAVAVKVTINGSFACPVLNGFGLYNDTVTGLKNSDLDYYNR